MGTVTETVEHRFMTRSAEETFALGRALGGLLRRGDFVGLVGELGAGKTQLARGIAEGAGVEPSEVASPTFAIFYPYAARDLTLFHADLYRVGDEDELYATGFFEVISEGAAMVEWLDHVPGAAPAELLRIELRASGEDSREILVTASGERHVSLLREWIAGPGK